MNNQLLLIKKENLNNYNLYLGDTYVGKISDRIKYGFFGLEKESQAEILVKNKKYKLICLGSGVSGHASLHCNYELFTSENKKIGKFYTSANFFENSGAASINSSNKINYFDYERYTPHSSIWRNENKIEVLSIKDNIFYLNDQTTLSEEDLELITVSTALVENLLVRKIKKEFRVYNLIVLIILLVFIFIEYFY